MLGLNDWTIGIIMANAQSFFSTLGLALQRYSHLQNEASKNPVPAHCQPNFLLGIVMYIGCQPLTVAALAYAPVSIIAPLGSLNIVYNAFICWILIGETFRRIDVVATTTCFMAAVGVVVFGPKPAATEKFPSDRLIHFWDFHDILIYVMVTAVGLLAGIYLALRGNMGANKVYCFAVIVAVVTAWSQLFVKCFSHELRHFNWTLDRIIPVFIVLVGIGATAISSLVIMTYACRNYENRFFVSAIAALRIVLQQVQGAVFFEEWRDANFSETALFVACCLICIGSVTFISVRNEKTKPAGVKKSKSAKKKD